MRIDIDIKHEDAYDCLDNLIVAVAEFWGRDFELFFAESWGFQYKRANADYGGTIAENLETGRAYRFDYLERFHGVKVEIYETNDYQDAMKIIKAELKENKPIIIAVNPYKCACFKEYVHGDGFSHYCLVIGIENNDNLIVADTQLAKDGVVLSAIDFFKGIKEFGTFTLVEGETEYPQWQDIIEKSIGRIINAHDEISVFGQIVNFREDIKKGLDFEKEISGYEQEPFQAPLFQKILGVGRCRKQFSKALYYLYKITEADELEIMSIRMKVAGERWVSIFGMLCKVYCLQENSRARILDKILNKIDEAVLEEERVAREILEICRKGFLNKFCKIRENMDSSDTEVFNDYVFLNLSKYYNNQGFSSSMSIKDKAEFSNGGRYFLNQGLPSDMYWSIGNMKFIFPEINDDKNDNISCFGEVIETEPISCTNIMVLGCAEFGDHSDILEILYHDGNIEKINLVFTSWLSPDSNYDEIVAWQGKGAVRDSDKVKVYPFPVSLFSKNYILRSRGIIKSLKLPECPNIHIFSITCANRG